MELDEEDPATWVGVGGSFTTAVLLESGSEAYNGTQGAPSLEMWDEIDPSGAYEMDLESDRRGALDARVMGEPTVSNPVSDVILSTFDACSSFAQEHVGHVLADLDLRSPCLVAQESFRLPLYTVTIYDVVPAS